MRKIMLLVCVLITLPVLGQAKLSDTGADVPAYNFPGGSGELKLTSDMTGIFLGKITNWNNPAIGKINPEVRFPDQEIIVVHRSDGSRQLK
ncbi:MAG TPA: hypothetical protein VGM18_04255 [Candidatus Sulfotelmatobacter sp.]|jgi:ABC-type phosphate transport system substrate-binding protein